ADIPNKPATDWTQIGDTGHAVQFYEHDDSLTELLAAYVGTAVVKGDGAIVIATRKHCEDLRAGLARRGLNLDIATSQGRYEALDAAETLGRISTEAGWPDRDRFRSVIGDVIERIGRATMKGRP